MILGNSKVENLNVKSTEVAGGGIQCNGREEASHGIKKACWKKTEIMQIRYVYQGCTYLIPQTLSPSLGGFLPLSDAFSLKIRLVEFLFK